MPALRDLLDEAAYFFAVFLVAFLAAFLAFLAAFFFVAMCVTSFPVSVGNCVPSHLAHPLHLG